MVLVLVCQVLFHAPPANSTWPELDTTQEAGWSLETRLAKRTFQMFEPIEIASKFRFVGEKRHYTGSTYDELLYCAAVFNGEEVARTSLGNSFSGPMSGSIIGSGISQGYTESDFVRLDTVLDMSLPGTYEVWVQRHVVGYPVRLRRIDRKTVMAYLSSPRYIIQVLPMPVVPVEPPRLRPELNLPEPTAEEREKKWQIVALPLQTRYEGREAIRVRVVTRYLGENPITLRRPNQTVPSLGGMLVFDQEGKAPRQTRFATTLSTTSDTKNYARDRWCPGFTIVEEVVPNLFFDMTRGGNYRLWVARYLYESPERDILCSSNTVEIYVNVGLRPWYLRSMAPTGARSR